MDELWNGVEHWVTYPNNELPLGTKMHYFRATAEQLV